MEKEKRPMPRVIIVSAFLLGIVGLPWSVFILLVFSSATSTLGLASVLIAIPILGTVTSVIGVAAAIVGRTNSDLGATLLVLAGGGTIVATLVILIFGAEAGIDVITALGLSLITGWWVYGLLIAGLVSEVRDLQAGR